MKSYNYDLHAQIKKESIVQTKKVQSEVPNSGNNLTTSQIDFKIMWQDAHSPSKGLS